jgi:hypothetical protein
VVLDGLDLSEEQSERISKAIQRSAMLELAELETGREDAGEPSAFGLALIQAIGPGLIAGFVATTDPANIGALVGSEFKLSGGEIGPP